MVISRTSAVDVSIQAVSPLSSLGASSAKAAPAVMARMPRLVTARLPAFFSVSMFILSIPFLERVAVGFAGGDANDLLERRDEDLSVADLAGLRLRGDRVDHRVEHLALHRHFDFELGQKAHGVFRAAIDFRMPLLPPIAFDLSHRHALNAERRKRLTHFIELEGFDDRRNKLHLPSFRGYALSRTPGPVLRVYQEAGQFRDRPENP